MKTAVRGFATSPWSTRRAAALGTCLYLLASPLWAPFALANPITGKDLGAGQQTRPATQMEQALEVPGTGTDAAKSGDGSATPQTPAMPGAAAPGSEDSIPVEIIRDMSALPAPVAAIRQKIMDAAATGDIEKLRPLTNPGKDQTQVMNGEGDDPVDLLKSLSGDQDGQEILAIFIDLLSTGAANFYAGKPDEVYVWPYFAGKPLASLTPPERVELLRIVTAGDLMGMEENGGYNFYRLGISPDGKWKFVAGGD